MSKKINTYLIIYFKPIANEQNIFKTANMS